MANRTITLLRVCKTDDGWQRLPIVMGKNGRIRPGYALVDGKPVAFPEGHYVLRSYEGTRTIFRNVGADAADAMAAWQRQSQLAEVRATAELAGITVEDPDPVRVHLKKKRDEYIERHLAKGQKRASETFKIAVDDFLEATKLVYADQVTEGSVLKFYKHLRDAGNKDRTIYNKHVSLFGFFKWLKLDVKELAERAPSYTKKEVQVYDAADLKVLFESAGDYQRVVYETLLKTGMRMQEAMHLAWPNVDFRAKKIRVREMLDDDTIDDVRIKDREERSIPLPDDLAATLRAWKKSNPGTRLVLGTRNDTPNWKMLTMLKRAARSAGLNCGRCVGCKGEAQECMHWNIKKFRSTYTTTLLQNHVDARTVMSYTGHKDLATVLLYLAPAKDVPGHKKVNAIKWM